MVPLPFLLTALAPMILAQLKPFIDSSFVVRWGLLEAELGRRLTAVGCEDDLRIRPEGELVAISVSRRILGALVPLRFLVKPVGVKIGARVVFSLDLLDATVERGQGVYARVVSWLVRLVLRWRYDGLANIVANSIQPSMALRHGNQYAFDITSIPTIERARSLLQKFPGNKEPNLGRLIECRGIDVTEEGLHPDLIPGPLTQQLIAVVGRVAAPF